jgi:hypothetical protein
MFSVTQKDKYNILIDNIQKIGQRVYPTDGGNAEIYKLGDVSIRRYNFGCGHCSEWTIIYRGIDLLGEEIHEGHHGPK